MATKRQRQKRRKKRGERNPQADLIGTGQRRTARGKLYPVKEPPGFEEGMCGVCGRDLEDCWCTGLVMDFAPVEGWLINGPHGEGQGFNVLPFRPKQNATPVTITAGHGGADG